jgi:PAS domain-containing protein
MKIERARSYRSRTGFRLDPRFVMIDLPNLEDAQKLAQAIVNTIPDPFLVLDDKIRVLAASRSFYEKFKSTPSGRGAICSITWRRPVGHPCPARSSRNNHPGEASYGRL